MIRTILHLACAALFCVAHAAHADTTANSSSGSISGSSSVGIGQGGGSSLNNIGTSSNSSATTNSNSSSVGGIGRATATGGNASAAGGSSNVNVSVTMPALTASTGTGAGTTSGTGSGSGATAVDRAATGPGSGAYDTRATVDYNQSSYSVRTTPSIAAPALTTTLSDTCMGSTSFGLSVTGFGVTGGTTQVDQACVRRLDAREFRAMGLTDVALALLCQSDANRKAVEATGHLCPGTTAPLARVNDAPQYSADEKYRDPIVRARLGLPVAPASEHTTAQTPRSAAETGQAAPIPAKVERNGIADAKSNPGKDDNIEVSLVK